MKRLPLVTVILTSYNHEKYIRKAILSVINQTYKNIQLIVIDDGSTDNSPKILKDMAKRYDFMLRMRENRGVCFTLNEAIQDYAKGEYITFIASDDYWASEKLEKQVTFMDANPKYGVCYANVYNIVDNKVIKIPCERKSGWIFNELFTMSLFIPSITFMFRSDVYDNVGLYNIENVIEDFDMILRVSEKYPIGYVDEYLAYYRLHANNTHKNFNKAIYNQLKIIKQWENHPSYKQAVKNIYRLNFHLNAIFNKKHAVKHLNTYLQILDKRVFAINLFKLFFINKFIYAILTFVRNKIYEQPNIKGFCQK